MLKSVAEDVYEGLVIVGLILGEQRGLKNSINCEVLKLLNNHPMLKNVTCNGEGPLTS